MSDRSTPEPTETWIVCRQDDHGNQFRISAHSSAEEARSEVERLEASAHKQHYWAGADSSITSPAKPKAS